MSKSSNAPENSNDSHPSGHLVNSFLAELSHARSARNGAPWVGKLGCEKIVRTYVHPFHVIRDEILHFKHPRVSAVNRIASRPFRDKNSNNKSQLFLLT